MQAQGAGAGPSTTTTPANVGADLRLAAVTLVWLALARWLERAGDYAIPDAWKRHVALQTFLIACQIATAVVGLALAVALLAPRPAAAALGLTPPPRARDVAATALLAPALFIASAAIALRIAQPVLLAEAATRGPGVSRAHAGAFGRALTESPLLPTLVWGVVLAALTEELLFRGALYATIERLVARLGRSVPTARWPGLVAATGAAVVFALMHWDLGGGVGLVRVVSTLCLGLACGAARHATASVAAPFALHLVHNTVALGQSRRWFADDAPPPFDTLPISERLLMLAGLGVVLVAAIYAASALARRRAAQAKALSLDE
jgi:membrane protease YdiL (CAAX protease family)